MYVLDCYFFGIMLLFNLVCDGWLFVCWIGFGKWVEGEEGGERESDI